MSKLSDLIRKGVKELRALNKEVERGSLSNNGGKGVNKAGVKIVPDNREYEKMTSRAIVARGGLYPPEIVMLYFCKTTNKYPSHATGKSYPEYWSREYGINDVDAILQTLENRDYLMKDERGNYRPTARGNAVLMANEHIIWAHKTHLFGGAWGIEKEMQRVPSRMSSWPWQDKVWWLFHDEQLRLTKKIAKLGSSARLTGECGDYRNSVLFQAQFLEYEKRYKDAANMYERVLEIDKKLDGDAYRPAPGVVESINKCRKRASK